MELRENTFYRKGRKEAKHAEKYFENDYTDESMITQILIVLILPVFIRFCNK